MASNPSPQPTCWACGSPWFEPDQYGTLRCCDCDADYSKKPASRRISADTPNDVRRYDGTAFEGKLDGCRYCPIPERFDIYAPYARSKEDGQIVCHYECDLGHRWQRGYGRAVSAQQQAPSTGKPSAKPAKGPASRRPVTPVAVDVRTAVYLHFDADDVLLYIGVTDDLTGRGKAHAKGSSWVEFAVRAEAVWCESRTAALAREKELIQERRPLFNRKHNDTPEARQRLVDYLVEHGRTDLLAPAVSRG